MEEQVLEGTVVKKTIEQLVNEAVEIEKQIAVLKAKKDMVASKIQQEALAKMKEKKIKTIQYFGDDGNYVLVTNACKVDSINDTKLAAVFGTNVEQFMTKKEGYDLKKECKLIAEGIFKGVKEKTVKEILAEIGLDEKQITVVEKKLKLDYVKDKKTLASVGLSDQEIDTYIFFIHDAMTYEKIKQALSQYKEEDAYNKAIEDIKASVIVEETPKITIKYKG